MGMAPVIKFFELVCMLSNLCNYTVTLNGPYFPVLLPILSGKILTSRILTLKSIKINEHILSLFTQFSKKQQCSSSYEEHVF